MWYYFRVANGGRDLSQYIKSVVLFERVRPRSSHGAGRVAASRRARGPSHSSVAPPSSSPGHVPHATGQPTHARVPSSPLLVQRLFVFMLATQSQPLFGLFALRHVVESRHGTGVGTGVSSSPATVKLIICPFSQWLPTSHAKVKTPPLGNVYVAGLLLPTRCSRPWGGGKRRGCRST